MRKNINAADFIIGSGVMVLAVQQYLFSDLLDLNPVWSDGLAWAIGILMVGVVLKALTPKFSKIGMLGLVLAYLLVVVGLVESLVVILFLLSSWTIGTLLLSLFRSKSTSVPASLTEATVLGGLIWIGVWGAMLHFPFNYRGLYLGLCLLSLLWIARLPRIIFIDLRVRILALHGWMQSIPFWAWVTGLALIGWVLRWASFPSLSFDDHAYHLRLWTELLTEQRALFDVNTQIWSVASFAGDLFHAGLSLMAGADVRSAMNLALALLLLVLMARILERLNLPTWVQWLLMMLMSSTPMLGNLLLSLQTELLLAVLCLAGLRLVLDVEGGWRGQHVLGVLACAALCAAIKLTGIILSATLLASLALRLMNFRVRVSPPSAPLRWPALIMLIPIIFVGLHSYFLAWQITGNPVFPLYNAVFLSPLFYPENFSDPRWVHGFSLATYVRAFFKTSEFFEGGDYTAGWQYLLLFPISFLVLMRTSIPFGFRLALPSLIGFGLVVFSATQYWRYMFPVMPIAGILLAVLFIGSGRYWRTLFVALTIFCIALNVYFFPRISWMMNSPAQEAYTEMGKQQLARLYAPASLLTAEVNRIAPNSRVLYPSSTPYGATLHGTPLYVNWYSPSREARFKVLRKAEEMAKFLVEENVDYAILNMVDTQASGSPSSLLRDHLGQYGIAVAQEGSFVLYRLSDAPTLYRKVFDLRQAKLKLTEEPELLLPISDSGIMASAQPKVLAVLPTHRASQARYSIRLRCPSLEGFFIAQINWDTGAPYYRLVACHSDISSFVESFPIPPRARQGLLYVTVRDTTLAYVENLQVEMR
jgi:hypothetical protein